MSKQSNYSPEEWKTLSTATSLAGSAVMVSDFSGPIGTFKELKGMVSVFESSTSSSNELIRSLAEFKKSGNEGTADLGFLKEGDTREAKLAAIVNLCQQAAIIVAQKSPAEADEFKRWLVSIAQKTAEAAKEGGFLGIGGTQVSDSERDTINKLASALGVTV